MKEAVKTQSETLKGLNQKQEAAVTFAKGPLLIIAGAGTGKTTVLTRRIAWLIESGLATPDEILALTFTVKATGEMEERVDQIMPLGYSQITISTFDAFAEKILRQHALDIGIPGDFEILDDTRAWVMMRNHIHDFNLDYYKPKGNPSKFIHALLRHFETAKREGVTPEKYLEYAQQLQMNLDNVDVKKKARKKKTPVVSGFLNPDLVDPAEVSRIMEVANAYHKYQKLLLDNSFLDFRDLINFTLKLFTERPKILKYYQNKYKYILVDEFQDTDLSQYELVKLMAHPQNNITVVGDDDQSIYKFRGASISNILKFKEDFPKASEVTLTDNYRSIQPILDLAYEFIQRNNPERLESRLKISKKLVSHKADGGQTEVIHARNIYEEARQTIEKIQELQEVESLGLNDFAILVRANDHAEPFLNELSRKNIPYIYVASRGLYRKPLILDILAYLKLLDNFHQSDYLFRVLNFKKFKIDHEDLILISHTASKKALSIYEVLRQLLVYVKVKAETQKKIEELLQTLDRHCKLSSELSVSELLVRIVRDIGITDELAMDSIESVENRSLLEQFYRKVQDFAAINKDKSLKNFLHEINLEQEAGDTGTLISSPDTGPEAVKVMTIHAAKGLEFSCVFIANMVEARFPSRDRREQIELPAELVKEILPEGDAHLMEERRLFYVSITRAKRFLYFTWADDYGGMSLKKPSLFLLEAGLEKPRDREKPSGVVFFTKQQPLDLPVSDHKFQLPYAFDFSQLSTFKKCPLEYKYKYLYKLPMPGAAALSFGITMHNVFKKYSQHMQQLNNLKQQDLFGAKPDDKIHLPPKELLEKYYAECWVDDWYPSKQDKENYRTTGKRYLNNFYQKLSENPRYPKYLEQYFKLPLGKYKFQGRIDRADLNPNGTVDIVDYKTGQPRLKLEQVDRDQLLIYQWAAQEGLKEKVNQLTYWYLEDLGKILPFSGSKEDIEKLKAKLLETIEELVQVIETNGFREADLRHPHECKFRHIEG
ncbi:MAG: ATP-dependent helicase [Candidatus Doudnabacteria bacterium]|nr:ATP-dependent helicase [Candidatus Doudnabacteria bacterium]